MPVGCRVKARRGPYKSYLKTLIIPRTSRTAEERALYNALPPTNLQSSGEDGPTDIQHNAAHDSLLHSEDELRGFVPGIPGQIIRDLEPNVERNEGAFLNLEVFEKYNLSEPIFPGSQTTKFEALFLTMHFQMRHGLTNVATADLLNLINTLIGEGTIPESKFKLDKIFSSEIEPTLHFYCSKCITYLGTRSECAELTECSTLDCGQSFSLKNKNNGNYFLTIPLTSQIRQFLEEPGVEEKFIKMDQRQNENPYLCDIFDGRVYKQLKEIGLLDPRDTLSITVNSDGSPVFKSSKNSLWPIQFRLNEIIPSERFAPHMTLVTGLWFGKSEPKMATFFVPLMSEVQKLSTEGLVWNDSVNKVQKCTKIMTIGCVADSVGKAMLQNIKQFNGHHGCPYCLHPGVIFGNSVKYPDGEWDERQNKSLRKDMVAAQNGRPRNGVKGLSPFYGIDYFNVVWGFPIDYMHCCLLGVMKFLCSLWFDTANHDKEFYLPKKQQQLIDSKLMSIRPPSNISRPPRSLSDSVHWKANEWRSFLLHYSFICLNGILKEEYFEHFCLFVSGIFLLLQEKISISEVRLADDYLMAFVAKFEILYGAENMRFNVHLLTHLARNVIHWGPLWTVSAFSFETGNGTLIRLVKGTRGVLEQIASKCIFYSSVSAIATRFQLSNNSVIEFCDKIMSYNRLKKVTKCDQATICGSCKLRVPSAIEKNALRSYGIVAPAHLKRYNKIILNGTVFAHDKGTTIYNDSLAQLRDGTFCSLEYFFQNPVDSQSMLFFGRKLKLSCNRNSAFAERGSATIYQIKVCELNAFENKAVYNVNCIQGKSILITDGQQTYISCFPNVIEKD